MKTLFLALGGNCRGPWGDPRATLCRARRELEAVGLRVVRASALYRTSPVGPGRQSPYLNAVLQLEAGIAPAALLRQVKRVERRAGRRLAPRGAPRSLDIDLLDHGCRRFGWPPGRRVPGRIVLPHPEMHGRPFVLVPLLEIAPHWRHPALGILGRILLARLGRSQLAGVRRALAFEPAACEKTAE
jgi:2-amino-4-hydroxy-6-hydroxymethyldihydropteridine diphosphokinase